MTDPDAASEPVGERAEMNELALHLDRLEIELAVVRQLADDLPDHVRLLEERLSRTQDALAAATEENRQLVAALREARLQNAARPREASAPRPAKADEAMLKLFNEQYRRVIIAARREARVFGHHYIGTEHMLLGLLEETDGTIGAAFAAQGVEVAAARIRVEELVGRGSDEGSAQRPFTPRAKTVLELSRSQARQFGHGQIGAEHLLLGLLRERNGVAVQVLLALGADLNRLREEVTEAISSAGDSAAPSTGEEPAAPIAPPAAPVDPPPAPAPQGVRPADAHVSPVFATGVMAGVEPSTTDGYFHRAERRCREEPDAAIADLDEAIRLDPDNGPAYRLRSHLRAGREDYAGGLADLDQSVRLKPGDGEIRADRGLFREITGDPEGALADYDETIRLDPARVVAFHRRGDLRRQRGDPEGALADYEEAIRLDPSNAEGFRGRGDVRVSRQDAEGALADYDEAIRLDPWKARSFMIRGGLRLILGQTQAGCADLDQAIRLDPEYCDALELRGVTRRNLGDLDGSVADFEEACRLKPGSAENAELLRQYRGERDAARP